MINKRSTKSLKKTTLESLGWYSVEKFSVQIIQFIIGIVLARLLSPVEFGILGMVTIFISISAIIIESGFSQALIQKNNVTESELSTVFYINIAISSIIYIILFSVSGQIAVFFNEPILEIVVKVIALNLIINAFSLIQATILVINLNFKIQARIAVSSSLISGVLGISLAYLGYGIWALIYQTISQNVIRALMLWYINKWKPLLTFSKNSFKTLFGYGSNLLLAGIFESIFQNIYSFIIGKYYSPAILGFYNQAKKIQDLPTVNINSILQKVTFPIFSKIQNEDERLKRGYKSSIKLIVYLNFFIMFFLFVSAEPFIVTVFSQKWILSALYLRYFAIIGLTYPLHAMNLNIIKVKGKSNIYLRIEVVKKIILGVIIVISIFWGIMGLIWGQVIFSIIAYFINSHYSGILINYPVKEQLLDILPNFILGIISAFITSSLILFVQNDYLLLLFDFILFASVYIIFSYLFKMQAFSELKAITIEYIQKTKVKFLKKNVNSTDIEI